MSILAEPLSADDMLAVAYSAEAAVPLSATSARIKAVKALPARLLTDADHDLRENLLDVHLPRVLSAFYDAHVAGSVGADADLIDGLEHIDAALKGLLAAARSRATDGLTIQAGFLEQRYRNNDHVLTAISDEPSRSAKVEGTIASKTLDRKTLLELLLAKTPAAPQAVADNEERLFGIRTRVLWMVLAPIPVFIFGGAQLAIDHQKSRRVPCHACDSRRTDEDRKRGA